MAGKPGKIFMYFLKNKTKFDITFAHMIYKPKHRLALDTLTEHRRPPQEERTLRKAEHGMCHYAKCHRYLNIPIHLILSARHNLGWIHNSARQSCCVNGPVPNFHPFPCFSWESPLGRQTAKKLCEGMEKGSVKAGNSEKSSYSSNYEILMYKLQIYCQEYDFFFEEQEMYEELFWENEEEKILLTLYDFLCTTFDPRGWKLLGPSATQTTSAESAPSPAGTVGSESYNPEAHHNGDASTGHKHSTFTLLAPKPAVLLTRQAEQIISEGQEILDVKSGFDLHLPLGKSQKLDIDYAASPAAKGPRQVQMSLTNHHAADITLPMTAHFKTAVILAIPPFDSLFSLVHVVHTQAKTDTQLPNRKKKCEKKRKASSTQLSTVKTEDIYKLLCYKDSFITRLLADAAMATKVFVFIQLQGFESIAINCIFVTNQKAIKSYEPKRKSRKSHSEKKPHTELMHAAKLNTTAQESLKQRHQTKKMNDASRHERQKQKTMTRVIVLQYSSVPNTGWVLPETSGYQYSSDIRNSCEISEL
ncbi:hypothetical protein EK904_004604 [Melospiza melodia maxima]|nr:hypothetical protein EK904_004604 [Melospiza melodia maxima]